MRMNVVNPCKCMSTLMQGLSFLHDLSAQLCCICNSWLATQWQGRPLAHIVVGKHGNPIRCHFTGGWGLVLHGFSCLLDTWRTCQRVCSRRLPQPQPSTEAGRRAFTAGVTFLCLRDSCMLCYCTRAPSGVLSLVDIGHDLEKQV